MANPLIRTPFTDLTSGMINCQYFDKCGERELSMMECLEAYGVERGKQKCKVLIEDFHECFTMKKQLMRAHVCVGVLNVHLRFFNVFLKIGNAMGATPSTF